MRLLTYLEAIITPWGRLRAEAAEPLRIGKRQTHPSIPSDRPWGPPGGGGDKHRLPAFRRRVFHHRSDHTGRWWVDGGDPVAL